MKNKIKGCSKKGYKLNGKKVTKIEARTSAKLDSDYQYYITKNGTKVIRSNPDNTKKDNVNNDK